MKRLIIRIFFFSIVLLSAGCDNDASQLARINKIKIVGEENPALALDMLDSLTLHVRKGSEYLQKKCDLLEIRLKDKAYIPVTSDIMVKELVEYFDKKGTNLDKQEAQYYAGSVYRDINDAPKAITHFLHARDIAEADEECDKTMLRNTYSNLHYIYYNVQDYQNALEMAKKEFEYSELFGDISVEDYFHIGASLQALDRKQEAMQYYDMAYKIEMSKDEPDKENLTILLYYYTRAMDAERARKCYEKVNKGIGNNLTANETMSTAEYLVFVNQLDSAARYFKKAFYNKSYPLPVKYDAARRLLGVCTKIYPRDTLAKYADIFINTSDSINLGTRQEFAATVNNKYKYNKDVEAEAEMKAKQEFFEKLALSIVLSSLLLLAFSVMMYFRNKYNSIRTILSKDMALKNMKRANIEMEGLIHDKEEQLNSSRNLLDSKTEQLQQINSEINRFKEEVSSKKEELERTQIELEEKVKQNELLLRNLHTFAVAQDAEDVKNKIDLAIKGKYSLQETDWGSLYQAVDRQYPTFVQELAEKLGTFDEKQKQFCYLIRMGLANGQIENLLGVSHVTIWRWSNKFREVLQLK